jgi:hypothetical protein
MVRRLLCWLLIALLSLPQIRAQATELDPAIDAKIKEAIESCFIPPLGATEKVAVSATFEADGSLRDKPEVILEGDGPLNKAFAKAAVRAILKCEPDLAGLGLKGKVTFNFDPSGLPSPTAPGDSPMREFATTPDGSQLYFVPPEGLCRVEPSRGGFEKKLWNSNPFGQWGAGLFSLWIDCNALNTARKGDFSTPPQRFLSMVELDPNPQIPDDLGKFIAFLANRDKDRYIPAKRFLDDPKLDGSTYLDHDQQAVYYGLRKVDAEDRVQGAGLSSYTLVANHPLVIWYFKFGSNFDDSLRSESKSLIESLHALNARP